MNARWIRLGALNPIEFETVTTRLARAQGPHSLRVLAWGEDEMSYGCALVTPRRLAPGRSARWSAWGLAAAVATYRQFGVAAYFEQEGIWLHGRCIGEARVQEIGECVLVGPPFLASFPGKCVVPPSAGNEDGFPGRLEASARWHVDPPWPERAQRAPASAPQ